MENPFWKEWEHLLGTRPPTVGDPVFVSYDDHMPHDKDWGGEVLEGEVVAVLTVGIVVRNHEGRLIEIAFRDMGSLAVTDGS